MPKDFIVGLIDLYRSLPCLWKVTSKEYTNKNLKKSAYDKLVEYARQYENGCTVHEVKQKIQNLRTTFRKEVRKVEDAKRRGSADDIYVPRLWYFNSLRFLLEDEYPQNSLESGLSTTSDESQKQEDNEEEEEVDGTTTIGEPLITEREPDYNVQESQRCLSRRVFRSSLPSRRVVSLKRKAQRSNDGFFATYFNSIKRFGGPHNASMPLNEYEATAISWAAKLRKLEGMQQVLAEDLINQVLKKGYFNELTRNTQIFDNAYCS